MELSQLFVDTESGGVKIITPLITMYHLPKMLRIKSLDFRRYMKGDRMRKIPEIVLVHWVDSASHPYWQDGNTEYSLLECYSVGFLIEESVDKLVIAQSAALDPDAKPWADVIVIPRVAVRTTECLPRSTGRETEIP